MIQNDKGRNGAGMKRDMIYHAHLAPNMREADVLFKHFCDWYKNSIKKAQRSPVPKVELIKGEVHVFMSFDVYKRWSIGKTYMLDGMIHHSGIPCAGSGSEI